MGDKKDSNNSSLQPPNPAKAISTPELPTKEIREGCKEGVENIQKVKRK